MSSILQPNNIQLIFMHLNAIHKIFATKKNETLHLYLQALSLFDSYYSHFATERSRKLVKYPLLHENKIMKKS